MKKILILTIAALSLFGCKKNVLEKVNPNQITTETYWKTESDVQAALAATYS